MSCVWCVSLLILLSLAQWSRCQRKLFTEAARQVSFLLLQHKANMQIFLWILLNCTLKWEHRWPFSRRPTAFHKISCNKTCWNNLLFRFGHFSLLCSRSCNGNLPFRYFLVFFSWVFERLFLFSAVSWTDFAHHFLLCKHDGLVAVSNSCLKYNKCLKKKTFGYELFWSDFPVLLQT